MKSVFKMTAVLMMTLPTLALAGELVLDPGSRVTVTASETITVTCSGSSNVGGSKKECEVITYNQTGRIGQGCGYNFCAFLYQYGQLLEHTGTGSAREAAAWCEEKTAQ